jgi:O-antigen/teichoic acid export membrane protein
MATISSILKFSKSREVQSVAIYTFSNFFNKGVSFLLLFYFAHVLTETDFGLLSLFSNSILLLMPFVSMGILQSANTEFFKLDKKEFKDFFTTTLIMPLVVMLIAMLVLFFFRGQLQQRYSFPAVFIIIIPLITFFSFMSEHLINMVRNNQEPLKYLRVNIGRLLAEILLAVLFISAFNYGWMGRVMAIFLSFLFVATYAFYYFKEKQFLFGKVSKKYLYDELWYSLPIIIMQISVFCMGSSAGYFIEYFTHDYTAVGIFSVAVTFGSIILVLCTALLQYVYPKLYSLLSDKEVDYTSIRKLFLFYSGAMLLGTMAVIILTPLAYTVMLKSSYLPGLQYFYFICIGNFFWSISYFFYAFMLYKKQKRKILFASSLSIFISIAVNYYFIKNMGSYGAALSIGTIYFVVFIITMLFVRKQVASLFSFKQLTKPA